MALRFTSSTLRRWVSDMSDPVTCTACDAKVPEMEALFKANTVRKKSKSGYSIRCIKGNWGVTAPTKEEAEREARHYFGQYLADGEYDEVDVVQSWALKQRKEGEY